MASSATLITLAVGAPVHSMNGASGRVERIAFDSGTRAVTHLIVRIGWPFPAFGRQVVVPLSRVIYSEDGGHTLYLNMEDDALRALPAFTEVDYVIVDPSVGEPQGLERGLVRRRIASGAATESEVDGAALVQRHARASLPPAAVTLGRGWHLACTDGEVSPADDVIVEADTGTVTYMVARCGGFGPLLRKRHLISAGAIRSIDDDEVVLSLRLEEVEALPDLGSAAYPAGHSLALAIQEALAGDPSTAHVAQQVHAFARGGTVELTGMVSSPHEAAAVDRVAASVPGATQTLNALVIGAKRTSSARSATVAALGVLTRSGGSVIDVYETAGSVTLTGVVPDQRTHDEALKIAGAVAGVSLVIDDLRVGTEDERGLVAAGSGMPGVGVTTL
jgi:hypothetical protein